MKQSVQANIAGREYVIETGLMAKQADGAVIVRSGDTLVLVTAVSAPDARPDVDFLPLTVDYQEKTYAAGRIPGGFFKREARPTERETLTSRLIDRPLRPLFPEGYGCETQVIAQVISAEPDIAGDVLAIVGASAALGISDIPLTKLVGGCRVCKIDGRLVLNPPMNEDTQPEIEILVAATKDAIVMVEGGAIEVSEADMIDALDFAHENIRQFIALQEDLIEKVGREKRVFETPQFPEEYYSRMEQRAKAGLKERFAVSGKLARNRAMKTYRDEVIESLVKDLSEDEKTSAKSLYKTAFSDLQYDAMREMILKEGKRIDGRNFTDIREVSCDTGVLPRAHGSALFTRGETQALVSVTLGTKEDEQRIEGLGGSTFRKFLLHYNFPPFSVGEVKFLRGPGRREIGHGKLAERAIEKVLPDLRGDFPYTVRIVSDILESNGSSSMATVCGASLALMDAGCHVKSHVAGIAMGLIKEGDDVAILSDILGDEDHLGDMDFKVCGTTAGITSIQMDIKIAGVTRAIMTQALEQARDARVKILDMMRQSIDQPRSEISPFAPRTDTMLIKKDRIKDVIGPGGKIIRSIIEETGVKIDIEDSGKVTIFATAQEAIDAAKERIRGLTADPEIGMIYKGVVRRTMDFGAFVEILPGTEGLVHISQLHTERVQSVEDIVQEGDEVVVKVLEIDRSGKIRLSRKEALGKTPGTIEPPSEGSSPPPRRDQRGGKPRGRTPHRN